MAGTSIKPTFLITLGINLHQVVGSEFGRFGIRKPGQSVQSFTEFG